MSLDESGRPRTERRAHDQAAKKYERSTGNPWHITSSGRLVVAILVVGLAIAVTGLFAVGVFR